jgi:response regulator of citrate/malate metabolism
MHLKNGPVVLVTRDARVGAMVCNALSNLDGQPPRLSVVRSMVECVAAVKLLDPSVVVLDDAVTDRPGPQLLEDLQVARSGVRVVYIASRHSIELERELRRLGVLFYVARPVESETLEATLLGILKGLLRSTA